MAYSSGNVLSMNELYDSLISFMTGSGWSVYDNIPISGSRDKVMFSSGSSGKLNMYYRISTNQFGNPYKDPQDAHVKFPHIFMRGYHNWNASTHTGSGEHGEFGPIILNGEQWSNSQTVYMYPFERADGAVGAMTSYTGYLVQTGLFDFVGQASSLTGATFRMGGVHAYHDGKRRVWLGSGTGVQFWDFVTGETRDFNAGFGTMNFHFCVPAFVKDANTDKEYIYVIQYSSTTFLRFDVDAMSWGQVASAPASNGGTKLIWDGNDTIYMHTNNTSTTFYKYTISTNTWTALASSPVSFSPRNFNGSFTPVHAAYVPASVTGFGEDVIYVLPTGGTTIYRYDVVSNAWRSTTGTGALTCPFTIAQTSLLYWDGKKHLYLQQPGANYRSDLSAAPNTFSYLGPVDVATRTHQGAIALQLITSKIRCSNVIPMKYFIHGDVDSVRVVSRIGTNPGDGRYYWSYMGQIDSAYRSNIMNVTTGVSPGVRINVAVDSNAGFTSGDRVVFANWSGSHFEPTTIYDMSGSSGFYCNLTSSFPAGTKVGIDPSQTILAGDTGKGIAAINTVGYKTDFESDWYHVWPESDYVSAHKNTPTVRGSYLPARIKIFNCETFSVAATTTIGSRTTNSKAENMGYLKSVYAIQQGSYPNPQNEDIVNVGTAQYIYFNPRNNALSITNADRRGILIGPIN